MNPIKRKQISDKVAAQTGHDQSLIDGIISAYYREVQRTLASVEHNVVHVLGLGNFVIQKKRVERKLEKYQRFYDSVNEEESMRAYATKQEVKADIDKYRDVMIRFDTEAIRKQEKNEEKIHYKKRHEQPD